VLLANREGGGLRVSLRLPQSPPRVSDDALSVM
jgi:hypothetical protein